jgi:hypothetical protein
MRLLVLRRHVLVPRDHKVRQFSLTYYTYRWYYRFVLHYLEDPEEGSLNSMINRILNKGILTLAAAICLLPASGFASVMFTMSGFTSGTSSYSGGVLTIQYTQLAVSINGGANTDYGGTYVETYNNGNGDFSLTGGTGNVSLTYDESANLVTTGGSAFNLYSSPVSLLTFNSAFLADLGLTSNPPVTAVPYGLQVVSAAIAGSTVFSATTQVTVTPEPSTFAMLGLALLCGIVYTVRRRSSANLSQS